METNKPKVHIEQSYIGSLFFQIPVYIASLVAIICFRCFHFQLRLFISSLFFPQIPDFSCRRTGSQSAYVQRSPPPSYCGQNMHLKRTIMLQDKRGKICLLLSISPKHRYSTTVNFQNSNNISADFRTITIDKSTNYSDVHERNVLFIITHMNTVYYYSTVAHDKPHCRFIHNTIFHILIQEYITYIS